MNKKHLIVKHEHTNCGILGKDNEAYLLGTPYWGNFRGNQTKHGNFHYWYPLSCNWPDCKFAGIVDWQALSHYVKESLKKQ